MKFLVQRIQGKLVHDFAFELTQAQDYFKWLGKEELDIEYAANLGGKLDNPDEYIPVGSVEFVSDYLRANYPEAEKALIPLNVPEPLMSYTERWIDNVHSPVDMSVFKHEKELHNRCQKLFRKSLTKIKDESNGIFDYDDDKSFIGYQVSEIVPIDSEWRVFVHKNEIQHIANYSGDCLAFPDRKVIEEMVNTYASEAPVAYTLDVGVRGNATFIIECHRFFSCGLYGFCDHHKIPYMLSQEWFEMKNMKDSPKVI